MSGKLKDYARMGVPYYVVFDPKKDLSDDLLRVYELGFGKRYRQREDHALPDLGLSLTLWKGAFEDKEDTWLRWLDAKGALILTGEERASKAEAEVERLRAELSRLKKWCGELRSHQDAPEAPHVTRAKASTIFLPRFPFIVIKSTITTSRLP